MKGKSLTLAYRLFKEPFPVEQEVLIEVSWNLRSNCCSFPVGQFQDLLGDLFKIRCLECFYCVGVVTGEDKFNAGL